MVEFCSFSSGSSGNCFYIGNEKSALLIDAGVSVRGLKKKLVELGLSFDKIEMVLITHDHVDHIKHLGTLSERYKKPVFTTERLCRSLLAHPCTRGRMSGCLNIINIGEEYVRDDIRFTCFPVPHDATETVGYFIDFYGIKFTFITDIGRATDEAVKYSKLANHLIIESNYDVDMLNCGTYPQHLKMRIMDGHGHLSNEECASLLKRAYHPELKGVYLCHLSNNNNTPQAAFSCAQEALSSIGVAIGEEVNLCCLPRTIPSELFEV